MRPVELIISAFGSFGGEERICFDRVQHGIFLVTGDTGAGKTTIFDAITYALYGQTSGGRREGSMMRSQFADDRQITYVQYTFQNKDGVYTVYRQPEQMRMSKRRGSDGTYGTTKEGAKVRLTLPDGTDYVGKGRETDAKLCEIVGLDAGQFTQIAMIAQGDFLQLLLASSRERREIFSRIFDTGVCEQVQMALERRYKELYGRLEDNRRLSEHDVEGIRLPKESAYAGMWEERGKLSVNDNAQLLELLDCVQAELGQREGSVQCRREELAKQLQELQNRITGASRHNHLVEQFRQALSTYEMCEAQKPLCETLVRKIDIGKRAAEVRTAEFDMQEKCRKFGDMQEKLHKIEERLEEHMAQTPKIQEMKQEAMEKKPSQGVQWSEQAVCLEQTLPKYESCDRLEKLYSEKCIELETAAGKERQAAERREQQAQNAEAVSSRLEELQNAQKELYQWREKEQKCRSETELLRAVLDREPVLSKLEEKAEKKRSLYLEADAAYAAASEAYERQNRRFLNAQAGIMAQELTDGKACPVCGSTHHPQPAPAPAGIVRQADVESARIRREEADENRQEASRASAQAGNVLEQERALLHADMERLMKVKNSDMRWSEHEIPWKKLEELALEEHGRMKEITDKVSCLQEAAREYEELQKEYKLVQEKQAAVEQECLKAADQRLKLQLEAGALKKEAEVVRKDLIYSTWEEAVRELQRLKDAVQRLQEAYDKASVELEEHMAQTEEIRGQMANGRQTLQQMKEEAHSAEETFSKKMQEQGFDSKKDYETALEEAVKLTEMEQQLQQLQITHAEAKASWESFENQLQGVDRNTVDTASMQEEQKRLRARETELEEELKKLYSIRTGNEERIGHIRQALQERGALEEQYAVINRLYKTAGGKLTGDYARLNFQTYMQRSYFKRVVHEANKRLRIMSRQQFELRCRDISALSKQGEAGLDLDVYSIVTGQVRDVKTLSGGESFMAALSMALGMADIIQNSAGSVRLDTMFIDEGFGTLDDESRREALRILDELAGGKRLIGIISHVTELKEQIPVRLHVYKDERGSRAEWK